MKKTVIILLVLCMCVGIFGACNKATDNEDKKTMIKIKME